MSADYGRVFSVFWLFWISLLATQSGCLLFHGQRYSDFIITTPLRNEEFLILGFMGGREPWNNHKRGCRKLALKLRSMDLPGVQVETIENKKRDLAIELILNAFDRNQDGDLDKTERSTARLILYGQSFGGAAVVKLARQLQELDIPVLLTVQINSVGIGDGIIPSNVSLAANLFQRNGWIIRGEPSIRAEDPRKTQVIANFEFDYSEKAIDLSEVSWFKRLFRTAHTKMDFDPDVWSEVEKMILSVIERKMSRTVTPGNGI